MNSLTRLTIPSFIQKKPYYVYGHLSGKNNEVFYIGIGTLQKHKSYSRAKSKSGRNVFWRNIVNKYGYTCVVFCESDSYEEIKELEKKYISLFGFKNDDGLLVNCTLGGDGCLGYKHTEEHKLRLKDLFAGKNNPMYGKKLSKEAKLKKSIRMSGENNPRYNKVGKENPRSLSVLKINPSTNKCEKEYESVRQASIYEKVSHTSIRKAIIKGTKCKTYIWKYAN
jgi:group I intron endonuclease